jgi:hypothetical protein
MSTNEITTIDNQFWLSMHLYVVEAWKRAPILLNFEKIVDGSTSNTMTSMIVESLIEFGGLTKSDLTKKTNLFWNRWGDSFLGCKNQNHHTTHEEICTISRWCALHGQITQILQCKP